MLKRYRDSCDDGQFDQFSIDDFEEIGVSKWDGEFVDLTDCLGVPT